MYAVHGVPALSHTRQTRQYYRSQDDLREANYF
jgi:hypothetical protein